MEEKNITKYLVGIIIALIIAVVIIFSVKTLKKDEEISCQECVECESIEKTDSYKIYLNNLKEFQKDKFVYTTDITYDLADRTELYAIFDKSHPLYKSLKDDYEDIPGYCNNEKCEQGVKVTDKEIVDIFYVKEGKKDFVFVIDALGTLYYINQTKNSLELKELDKYKKIIYIFNSNDMNIIQARDIEGNTQYLNLE